jgi:uncharacterized membrane protein YccC
MKIINPENRYPAKVFLVSIIALTLIYLLFEDAPLTIFILAVITATVKYFYQERYCKKVIEDKSLNEE